MKYILNYFDFWVWSSWEFLKFCWCDVLDFIFKTGYAEINGILLVVCTIMFILI